MFVNKYEMVVEESNVVLVDVETAGSECFAGLSQQCVTIEIMRCKQCAV